MIGNLISWQAFTCADLLREIVEIASKIVVRNDQLAGFVQRCERRVRLDGQLIKREMFGRLRNGALELGRPGIERLARPCIDKIERITIEDRARYVDRIERLLHRVQPAKFFERGVIERLYAERYAIDAGRPV